MVAHALADNLVSSKPCLVKAQGIGLAWPGLGQAKVALSLSVLPSQAKVPVLSCQCVLYVLWGASQQGL